MINKLKKRIAKFSEHPLTKNKVAEAMFRYMRFHLIQRILPKPRVYPFVGEIKFVAKRGMAGIVGNIYTGLFDFEEMMFLIHALRCEDVFLDVGANVGAYSLLASGIKDCRSLAIEPVDQTYQQLIRNITLNGLESLVECFQVAIGDRNGVINLSDDKGVMNGIVEKGEGVEVESITIDGLLKGMVVPYLMKIDVEGYELPVLSGAKKTLGSSNCQAVIIELNGRGRKYGYRDKDVHSLLLRHGFEAVAYNPFARKLKKIDFYRSDSFNTIYVKDFDEVQDRLFRASAIEVLGYTI